MTIALWIVGYLISVAIAHVLIGLFDGWREDAGSMSWLWPVWVAVTPLVGVAIVVDWIFGYPYRLGQWLRMRRIRARMVKP